MNVSRRAWRDAEQIAKRLTATSATTRSIATEYGCCTDTIGRIYASRVRPAVRERARARKISKVKRGVPTGVSPWNAGMKGLHVSPATEFKPGQLRAGGAVKYRPVGTITTRTERNGVRRRWIKVSETADRQHQWIPLAKFLWERVNGPVPAGHRIMHRDGQTIHDAIENLVCVSGAQSLKLIYQTRPGSAAKAKRRATAATKRRWIAHREIAAFRKSQAADVAAVKAQSKAAAQSAAA